VKCKERETLKFGKKEVVNQNIGGVRKKTLKQFRNGGER